MSASSKQSRKAKKNRSKNLRKRPLGRLLTPDCSGLTRTTLGQQLSEEQSLHLLRALVIIGDDFIPEIDFPFHADSNVGTHPYETEVMMFFPGVKTKHKFPVHHTMTLSDEHFVVAVFPDTDSPLGETGLMYVCRQFKTYPTINEAIQFVVDSVDGTWVVRGL